MYSFVKIRLSQIKSINNDNKPKKGKIGGVIF